MDSGRRRNKVSDELNKKLYMELKDIVREHTLPFLPAKSLLKFRSVCWDWNRWILSPFLAHSQSYSFHDVSGLFCQSPGNEPSFISLNPSCYGIPDPSLEFLQVPVQVKTSCNGLICCRARTGDNAYYVCNPLNKQFKKLPKADSHHGEDSSPVLIFDPSLLSFSANYKLVCAFPSSDFDDGHEFEIYSSETGSWKLSGEICFGNRKLSSKMGVHVKGIVYWLCSDHYVIAFDLAKDRSRLIASYFTENGCLCEMNGELCHVTVSGRTVVVRTLSNAYSNTMEMNYDHGTWSEKHRISLNDVLTEQKLILSTHNLVLLCAGGSHVVAEVGDDTVISYNIRTKQCVISSRSPKAFTPRALMERYIPYVNSLVSLV